MASLVVLAGVVAGGPPSHAVTTTAAPSSPAAGAPSPTISASAPGSGSPTQTASPTPTPTPTAATPRPPIVPAGQSPCQAVALYGVRGAGMSSSTDAALGPVLAAYGARLKLAYGSSRVGFAAADYPAVAVPDPSTAAAWKATDVTAAVSAGAATVAANLTALAQACPTTAILFLGGQFPPVAG
ncbi:MAG: hypothetical protein U0Q15_07365 [Kineosporiaceae bacterium]